MRKGKPMLTLDRPATYQIKVLGHLDENWANWDTRMTVTVENEDDGLPITTLTGAVDQAALHGRLRWLYSLGMPLILVICIETGQAGATDVKTK